MRLTGLPRKPTMRVPESLNWHRVGCTTSPRIAELRSRSMFCNVRDVAPLSANPVFHVRRKEPVTCPAATPKSQILDGMGLLLKICMLATSGSRQRDFRSLSTATRQSISRDESGHFDLAAQW